MTRSSPPLPCNLLALRTNWRAASSMRQMLHLHRHAVT